MATPTSYPYVPITIGHHKYNYYNLTHGHLNITDPQTQVRYFLSVAWAWLELMVTECTPSLCSLILGNFQYQPSIAGNGFLLAFSVFFLIINVYLGYRHKTWSFMGCMLGGLILEVVGYVGRLKAHHDPFGQNPFLIYIICLTLGPAFFTAAIYVCFARIVMVYGEMNARFKPGVYVIVFVAFDIISLLLQGAGGGIASVAVRGSNLMHKGINVMIGGLAWQVVSMTAFLLMAAEFTWRTKKNTYGRNPALQALTQKWKWTAFLCGLAIATVTIYVRCIYRVIELNAGFDSSLANNEVLFTVLESTMVGIAVLALSVFHPSSAFGPYWAEMNFSVRRGLCKNDRSSRRSSTEMGPLSGLGETT